MKCASYIHSPNTHAFTVVNFGLSAVITLTSPAVWPVLTHCRVTLMLRRSVKEPYSDEALVSQENESPVLFLLSLLTSYRMATATIMAAVAPSSVFPSQPHQAVPCQCPPPFHQAQPAFPPTTEMTVTASAAPHGPLRPPPVL